MRIVWDMLIFCIFKYILSLWKGFSLSPSFPAPCSHPVTILRNLMFVLSYMSFFHVFSISTPCDAFVHFFCRYFLIIPGIILEWNSINSQYLWIDQWDTTSACYSSIILGISQWLENLKVVRQKKTNYFSHPRKIIVLKRAALKPWNLSEASMKSLYCNCRVSLTWIYVTMKT